MRKRRVKGRLLSTAAAAAALALSCVSDPNTGGVPDGLSLYPEYNLSRRHETPPRAARPIRPRPPTRRRMPVVDYDPAWLPARRRISRRWTTIVIHHSATNRGGAREFDKFHRKKGWDELGYHFVIGNGTDTPDGYVEVGPRWHKQKHGAHCKTPGNYYNEHGIGVCLVGDFTKTRPTRKQLASLTRLVRFLSDRCRISPGKITTHGIVTGKTKCPGRRFSLARLQRSLSAPPTATSLP